MQKKFLNHLYENSEQGLHNLYKHTVNKPYVNINMLIDLKGMVPSNYKQLNSLIAITLSTELRFLLDSLVFEKNLETANKMILCIINPIIMNYMHDQSLSVHLNEVFFSKFINLQNLVSDFDKNLKLLTNDIDASILIYPKDNGAVLKKMVEQCSEVSKSLYTRLQNKLFHIDYDFTVDIIKICNEFSVNSQNNDYKFQFDVRPAKKLSFSQKVSKAMSGTKSTINIDISITKQTLNAFMQNSEKEKNTFNKINKS